VYSGLNLYLVYHNTWPFVLSRYLYFDKDVLHK